jgi:hypothetical protein
LVEYFFLRGGCHPVVSGVADILYFEVAICRGVPIEYFTFPYVCGFPEGGNFLAETETVLNFWGLLRDEALYEVF